MKGACARPARRTVERAERWGAGQPLDMKGHVLDLLRIAPAETGGTSAE